MKCEDAQATMQNFPNAVDPGEFRRAEQHLLACTDCQHALRAVQVLLEDASSAVPPPSRGAFSLAMLAATQQTVGAPHGRQHFWLGMGVGGALAAGIVLAVLTIVPIINQQSGGRTPVVALALNEVRDVSISLDSPEPRENAQIHVVLNGAIGLSGFDGQKELRWSTNLDRGVNQLTLPIVALGQTGGQLLVEVQVGEKRKTFLIDIRAEASESDNV